MSPKLNLLYSSIDLKLVEAAIKSEPSLTYIDHMLLSRRLMRAAELWLLKDMEAQALWVEQEFDFPQAHGFIDLVKVTDRVGGIVDWKTTHSIDRPNFVEELKADPQSGIYLTYGGKWLQDKLGVDPKWIEYRCLDDKGNTLSFKVEYSPHLLEDALQQVRSIQQSYLSLKDLDVWPRNKPRACFIGSKNGATCPYWEDCTHMTMPRGTEPSDPERTFESLLPRSKSGMKDFMKCNELFRRSRVKRGPNPESYELSMGQAFHEAAATLWGLAWEVREVLK